MSHASAGDNGVPDDIGDPEDEIIEHFGDEVGSMIIRGRDRNWDPHEDWLDLIREEESLPPTDSSTYVHDGDEITYVNSERNVHEDNRAQVLTTRLEAAELEWTAVLQRLELDMKILGHPEVEERPTPQQWALMNILGVWECSMCNRLVPWGQDCPEHRRAWKQRRYQLASDWDSDSSDGRGAAGVEQFIWLKLPDHHDKDRYEAATAWAQTYCRPGGVQGMINCLLAWWGQRITAVLVITCPHTDTQTGQPKTWANDLKRRKLYTSISECMTEIEEVRACLRARRAASSEEYAPEVQAPRKPTPEEIQDYTL